MQLRNDSAEFIFSNLLRILHVTQIEQFFDGVKQRHGQDQLGIAALEGASDLLQPVIGKRFNRLNPFDRGRTSDRDFTTQHPDNMGSLHAAVPSITKLVFIVKASADHSLIQDTC